MIRRQKGFTLLELLVVVAIIGVIATIAIPNLLVAIQRARQRRTMVDIRNMASAWEARNSDAGRYNAAGQLNGVEGADQPVTAADLQSILTPTYTRTIPDRDAWGTPFQMFADQPFGSSTKKAYVYAIISGGKDGIIEADVTKGPFTNYDCDIVYSNGVFLSYPDGITFNK